MRQKFGLRLKTEKKKVCLKHIFKDNGVEKQVVHIKSVSKTKKNILQFITFSIQTGIVELGGKQNCYP